MNPFVLAKSAKNALSKVEINFNRLAGRELVPIQTKILNIETSSLCNLECVFCAYVKKSSPKVDEGRVLQELHRASGGDGL